MQLRIYTQPALFRLLLLIFCCLFRRPHARPFDDSTPFWIIQHLLLTVVAAVTALFNRDAAVSRAIPYTRSANFDRNDSRTDWRRWLARVVYYVRAIPQNPWRRYLFRERHTDRRNSKFGTGWGILENIKSDRCEWLAYNGTWKIFNDFRSSVRNGTYTSWQENLLSLIFTISLIMSFFFFLSRAKKTKYEGFTGRSSRHCFSYIDRFYGSDGDIYAYTPHGRHTSRNRHGTIRMIRVVYEDYCYWLLPRLEWSIIKNRWQKIDDREIKIYVVSLSRNFSSITAHCRITS